jgi:hypothetical protein
VEEEVHGAGYLGVAGADTAGEENSKLKRLVADLKLDKHILAEVVRKNV